MVTVTFDTLKFVHRLKDAGIPEQQAEAFTYAFQEATADAEIATKRDLERMEAALKQDSNRIEAELKLNIERMEAALRQNSDRVEYELKLEIQKVAGDLTLVKWMLGIVVLAEVVPLVKALFS
jgi:hypothetical protein